jgi:hypothetical protein
MATYTFYVYGPPTDLTPPVKSPVIGFVKIGTPYPGDALEEARITFPNAVSVYLQKMEGTETDHRALDYVIGRYPMCWGVPSEYKR